MDASRQRDDKGRFKPGTAPGPGRPRRAYKASVYLKSSRAAVSPEKVAEIVEKLASMALGGDVRAAVIVLRIVMPRIDQIDERPFYGDSAAYEEDEFRVAGRSWSQIDRDTGKLLLRLAKEQDEYERGANHQRNCNT